MISRHFAGPWLALAVVVLVGRLAIAQVPESAPADQPTEPTPAAEAPAAEASGAEPTPASDAAAPASEAPAPADPASAASAAAPKSDPGPLPADVPEKHWASGAVRTVLKGGLMDLAGGKFSGAQTATRRDLALVIGALLVRAGKTAPSVKPVDVAPGDPGSRAIGIASGSGAMHLRKGNRLGVNQNLQREDIAIGFSRLLAVVRGEREGPVSPPQDLNDLPPDSPLYIPVQRVLKAKIISLVNLKYEGYQPVTRFQLAAVAVKALEALKSK